MTKADVSLRLEAEALTTEGGLAVRLEIVLAEASLGAHLADEASPCALEGLAGGCHVLPLLGALLLLLEEPEVQVGDE